MLPQRNGVKAVRPPPRLPCWPARSNRSALKPESASIVDSQKRSKPSPKTLRFGKPSGVSSREFSFTPEQNKSCLRRSSRRHGVSWVKSNRESLCALKPPLLGFAPRVSLACARWMFQNPPATRSIRSCAVGISMKCAAVCFTKSCRSPLPIRPACSAKRPLPV